MAAATSFEKNKNLYTTIGQIGDCLDLLRALYKSNNLHIIQYIHQQVLHKPPSMLRYLLHDSGPRQVVTVTDESFEIDLETISTIFKKVGCRPFVLYSINGATRTGKSYALNRFLHHLTSGGGGSWNTTTSTFPWRSGKERMTTGIHLWSDPFIVDQDGREVALLLMDCQGLFDEQTTSRQNAIIFALSNLFSSVSIFNVMKNVDEHILQQVEFFTGYSNTQNFGEDLDQEDSMGAQSLIFLIRDLDFPEYSYGYHDNKTQPSDGDNFFKKTFLPIKADAEGQNIRVRSNLLKSYQNLGTFLMPYPGKSFVRQNQGQWSTGSGDTAEPDEDFKDSLEDFVRLMLSQAHLNTKKVGQEEVTGVKFLEFLTQWVSLCRNDGEVFPSVQTISEATATLQMKMVRDGVVETYEQDMNSFIAGFLNGMDEKELQVAHDRNFKNCVEMFLQAKGVSGKRGREEFCKELEKILEGKFENLKNQNILKVEEYKLKLKLMEDKKEAELKMAQETEARLEAERKLQEEEGKNKKLMGGFLGKLGVKKPEYW